LEDEELRPVGRIRTFLDAADSSSRLRRPLRPPRPFDQRLRKLAGAHVNVAGEPIEEFAFRLMVFADGVEQSVDEVKQCVGTGTPRILSSRLLPPSLNGWRCFSGASSRAAVPRPR
jgi:hypothetical protein